MKTFTGKRNPNGSTEVWVLDGQGGRLLDPDPSLRVANHSPTGFEWGLNSVRQMKLNVAVCAKELEVLRVNSHLFQNLPGKELFCGWVDVMEVQCGLAPSVSTFRTATSKQLFDPSLLQSFLFTESNPVTLWTGVPPPFIAGVVQATAANFAITRSPLVNTGTHMLVFTRNDLAAIFAADSVETGFTVTGSPVAPVWYAGFTFSAEHWRVRSHIPTGYRTIKITQHQLANDGPAQLALALLLEHTGDEELARMAHQMFKCEVVADWGQAWTVTGLSIDTWLSSHALAPRPAMTAAEHNAFPKGRWS